MCWGCWLEAGEPIIDSPAVRAATEAIAKVYKFSHSGGHLHIIIDDWNLGSEHLTSRADDWIDENYHNATPEQQEAEREALHLLRALSEEERYAALALYNKFWTPEGGVG